MVKHIKGNNFLLVPVGILCLVTASILHSNTKKPTVVIDKQQSATNVNWLFLKILSSGNKRLISNFLWIQTLLESDLDHYKERNLNSWMYLRFRTISELDPKFYENYLYGGLFLSIIKDDLVGAADIYERGIAHYPKDYQLHYNAGFNYYFEMGNFKKGLYHLEQIQDLPETPEAIKFIINKLRFETGGDYEAALDFITYNISKTKDPVLLKKLKSDLYALKAEKDLKCLNENLGNCSRYDAEREPYIYQSGKWRASRDFLPFKIHRQKK